MDTIVIIAISIILAGSLILAALALWLAVDRRRNQSIAQRQPGWQERLSPAPPISPRPPAGQPPAAAPRATPQPAPPGAAPTPERQPGAAGPAAADPARGAIISGEYPAASLYDQTILPEPPKKRTHPQQR